MYKLELRVSINSAPAFILVEYDDLWKRNTRNTSGKTEM